MVIHGTTYIHSCNIDSRTVPSMARVMIGRAALKQNLKYGVHVVQLIVEIPLFFHFHTSFQRT